MATAWKPDDIVPLCGIDGHISPSDPSFRAHRDIEFEWRETAPRLSGGYTLATCRACKREWVISSKAYGIKFKCTRKHPDALLPSPSEHEDVFPRVTIPWSSTENPKHEIACGSCGRAWKIEVNWPTKEKTT